MQKILIVSLRSEFDVISSSKVVSRIAAEQPHSEIHFLTYSRYQDSAEIINNVARVHTISQEKIKQIFQNPVYSDGFAINRFYSDLRWCIDTNWDVVVNHSNDNVSAYLISSLNFTKVIGTTIAMSGNPITTNKINEYINFVASSLQRQPLDLQIAKMEMCELPWDHQSTKTLIIREDHAKIAEQNFRKIRESHGGPTTKIIAVSLAPNYHNEILDTDSIEELVEELEQSHEFKVVLLIENNNMQKELVNKLNFKLNNKLISISAQKEALTGVLVNVDVVVSANNAHLYVADVLGIPAIEIVKNWSEQRVGNKGNYSIIAQKYFHNEVNFCLNSMYGTTLSIDQRVTESRIYRVESDKFGPLYSQIQGPLDIQSELTYHVSRVFCSELLGKTRDESFLKTLASQCDKQDVATFVSTTKEALTNNLKALLSALRTLKSVKTSKDGRANFLSHLEQLMTISSENTLTQVPVLFFEAEVNNSSINSFEDSLKETERNLFELKNNFQKLSAILETLGKGQEIDQGSSHTRKVSETTL